MRVWIAGFAGLVAAFGLGCRLISDPSDAGLDIVASPNALFPGQTAEFVLARDSVVVANDAAAWHSSAPGVAAVDAAGIISALAPGVVTVYARSDSDVDSVMVRVIVPPSGRIVFVGTDSLVAGVPMRLWQVGADGTGARFLGNIVGPGPPAFSPDGRSLAVPVGTPPQLWVVDSETGLITARPDTGLGCGASKPAWSPDGQRLAFSSCATGRFEVWLSTLDGTDRERLTTFGAPIAQDITFAPDGGALLVASGESQVTTDNRSDLYRIDLTTRAVTRLPNTPPIAEEWPAADSVHGVLYFTREVPERTGRFPDGEHAVGIYRSDFALANPLPIVDLDVVDLAGSSPQYRYPAVSPDGGWLAFARLVPLRPDAGTRLNIATVRVGGFAWRLFVMRLADSALVQLTGLPLAAQPTWSN